MEAFFHAVVLENTAERHQAHALMVGHVGANQYMLLTLRHSCTCVVNRLVETIRSECPFICQTPHVLDCRAWIDLSCQDRRVRCNHEVFNQSTLKAQPGNAKRPVLVIEVEITDVVSGFRNSPRHAAFLAVFDLPAEDSAIRL